MLPEVFLLNQKQRWITKKGLSNPLWKVNKINKCSKQKAWRKRTEYFNECEHSEWASQSWLSTLIDENHQLGFKGILKLFFFFLTWNSWGLISQEMFFLAGSCHSQHIILCTCTFITGKVKIIIQTDTQADKSTYTYLWKAPWVIKCK